MADQLTSATVAAVPSAVQTFLTSQNLARQQQIQEYLGREEAITSKITSIADQIAANYATMQAALKTCTDVDLDKATKANADLRQRIITLTEANTDLTAKNTELQADRVQRIAAETSQVEKEKSTATQIRDLQEQVSYFQGLLNQVVLPTQQTHLERILKALTPMLALQTPRSI